MGYGTDIFMLCVEKVRIIDGKFAIIQHLFQIGTGYKWGCGKPV